MHNGIFHMLGKGGGVDKEFRKYDDAMQQNIRKQSK